MRQHLFPAIPTPVCRPRSAARRLLAGTAVAASAWLLAACGSAPVQPVQAASLAAVPAHWSAPLPDSPQRTADLARWWHDQQQPELAALIDSAQQVSPSVAAASLRIAQAQAAQAQARSLLLPQLGGALTATSTRSPVQRPALNQLQAGLQFSWELNLATLRGADAQAAQAQRDAAQLQWHDARILVAVEVANLYQDLRSCHRQQRLLADDAASLSETVRYTQLAVQAGHSAPVALSAMLINAADGRNRLQQQEAACEVQLQALAALTAVPAPALRERLAPLWQRQDAPQPFAIDAVPARTLAQRPDVLAAERQVLLAQAQLLQADAARLPRLSLQGLIGPGHVTAGAGSGGSGPTWTIGPLALTLPLFDAGARAAQQAAARAAVDAAMTTYQAQVRQAVRDVEEALLQLRAAEHRWQNGQQAADQARALVAVNHRLLGAGLISRLDFEAVQRQGRAADLNALALDLERQRSWITLYRAVGGGFQPTAAAS